MRMLKICGARENTLRARGAKKISTRIRISNSTTRRAFSSCAQAGAVPNWSISSSRSRKPNSRADKPACMRKRRDWRSGSCHARTPCTVQARARNSACSHSSKWFSSSISGNTVHRAMEAAMLRSTALATPALLRLSEVRASRMEVKFMCDRKAKVARRDIAACGRSFFRGDCCAVPVSGEAAQQALWRGVA